MKNSAASCCRPSKRHPAVRCLNSNCPNKFRGFWELEADILVHGKAVPSDLFKKASYEAVYGLKVCDRSNCGMQRQVISIARQEANDRINPKGAS